MFWSKSSKKPDNSAILRDRLLRDLRASFPSIWRPNNDDNMFELQFQVQGQYSTLRIYIPLDFPGEKPTLQVVGSLSHPWLDAHKRVHLCDQLNSWNNNSSLVDVVQTCLSALQSGSNAPAKPVDHPPHNTTHMYRGAPTNIAPNGALQTHDPHAATLAQQNVPVYQAYPALPMQTQPNITHQQQPPHRGSNPAVNYPTHPPNPVYTGPPTAAFPAVPVHIPSNIPQYGGAVGRGGGGAASAATNLINRTAVDARDDSAYQNMLAALAVAPPPQQNGQNFGGPVANLSRPNSDSNLAGQSSPLHAGNNNNNKDNLKLGGTPNAAIGLASVFPMPEIPDHFPQLRVLTESQLQNLLDNPEAFQAFVSSFQYVESMISLRDEIILANQAQAQKTIEMEAEEEALRKEVLELQSRLRENAGSYKADYERFSKLYSVTREEIVHKLKSKKDSVDTFTEDVAERFVDGTGDIAAFLSTYVEARKEYYTLSAKLEKAGHR